MEIKCVIRIGCVVILYIQIIFFGYFLKNRRKYSNILENQIINIILVISYGFFCYVPVLLPNDNVIKNQFLSFPFVQYWYSILGFIICITGITLLITTIIKRKAIGAQDTKGRLLITGIYHFARHPIYLGIILVAAGLVISFKNISGLIVFPFIVIANILEAKLEEKFDMEIRFKEDYIEYRKQTGIFGPVWFWFIILVSISFPFLLFRFILKM